MEQTRDWHRDPKTLNCCEREANVLRPERSGELRGLEAALRNQLATPERTNYPRYDFVCSW